MKILEVKTLALPEVKVIKFARFLDGRGYFTEPFRESDFFNHPAMKFMGMAHFSQVNESYSKPGVVRGLHFQWNPYMGKLVRTVMGHMADMVMDIRLGSPNFGKIIAYDMPTAEDEGFGEWIWVPVGFAHGNFYMKESKIEYFCTSEYSPTTEAGISPLAQDIDWSLCDPKMKQQFDTIIGNNPMISDKDRQGLTLTQWKQDERSQAFQYKK